MAKKWAELNADLYREGKPLPDIYYRCMYCSKDMKNVEFERLGFCSYDCMAKYWQDWEEFIGE